MRNADEILFIEHSKHVPDNLTNTLKLNTSHLCNLIFQFKIDYSVSHFARGNDCLIPWRKNFDHERAGRRNGNFKAII